MLFEWALAVGRNALATLWAVRRVAVVGQSHCLSLLQGAEASWAELPAGFEITFVVADWRGTILRAVASRDGLERKATTTDQSELFGSIGADDLCLAWWGTQMQIRALLQVGEPFDVLLPGNGARRVDGELIPYVAVEGYVRGTLDSDPVLSKLLSEAAGRRWLLAPPAPLPEPAVRSRLARSPHFVGVLEQLGMRADEAVIVPEAVRVRLRQLLVETYREFGRDHDATLIDAPQGSSDAEGLLKEEYWSTDVTHANAAYGRLYLFRLLEILGA